MNRNSLYAIATLSVASIMLSACGSSPGGSSAGDTGPQGPTLSAVPTNKYDAANGCYALESVANGQFAVASESGYQTSATEIADAEAFFFKAATLGKFLLYNSSKELLSLAGSTPVSSAEPTDAAIWNVEMDETGGHFTLAPSTLPDQFLAVNSAGNLVLTDVRTANTAFLFTPTEKTCAEYPEMPVGVVGDTFKGNGVNQPAIGFADVHTHQGMGHELSYADDVGPSAGGVLYGQTFNRFGAPKALEDCEEFHGPNGASDANNILAGTPGATHNTQGWPTFADWPRRDFLTHQVMYYRWVERAWMSGLRLVVNHGTNIAALCRIGQIYAGKPEADCNDMSIGVKQVKYLYDLQDYIDAQSGGPGKGWYRIVTSPQQAREVINDGKLAVVLGLEFAQVFDCGVTFTPLGETRNCDEEQIKTQLAEVWELGVRHIYLYHDIDSSLGGTGIFSGDVINYLNFMDTGQFWKTVDCREYPEDEPSQREPGAEQVTGFFPGGGSDPVANTFFSAASGLLPVYPSGPRCNERTVTDLGEFAINASMDTGLVLDIDHAAYHSKDIMLDIAEERDPPYPFASTHDAHGGLTSDQAQRMLKSGGIIYPYKGNGVRHVQHLENLKFWRNAAGAEAAAFPLAAGYGADANGFGGHPGPRGGDSEPVQYPFILFDGPDWGPQFDNIDPITVNMLTIPESGKFWHIDEVGMAHYGMVADFVEEVRLEGGQEALEALYNSAEAYLQLWERSYNQRVN